MQSIERRKSPSLKAVKDLIAAYRSARTSIQLQKAAKELVALLTGHLSSSCPTDQKPFAGLLIAAFNAAYESFQGAHQDPGRLYAALSLAKCALKGLKGCKSVIKGRKFEVEIQQYSLVRKLVALKAYRQVQVTFCCVGSCFDNA